ncbi:MAG: hypothetical protein ACRDPK_20840 [Carbonactinosporaceae bacterium]
MTVVDVVELLAWALSAVIAGWLLTDLVRVSRRYDEDFLTNPVEGLDLPGADAPSGQPDDRRERT